MRQVFRKHLSTPAAKLDRATVVQVHDALAKTSPVMAARAIAYASAAYGWAILRSSLAANPFEKIPTTAASKRERVLSDEELRAVWNATGGELAFDSIVRLLMLTGQRRGEVAGMTWNEISADGKTWTIPGVRTKNGAEHVVPLSRQAQAIIAAQPRRSATDLVFPARRGPFNGWPVAKDRLDHASGVSGWVLHDLRRTVATNLQRLGVRLEVTEAILNHVSGSRAGIVGVYQKHDWAVEKIRDLQAWADRLEAIVEGREAGNNVVELKTAAER